MSADAQAIRERALNLLARREHSRQELIRKLTARGYPDAAAEAVVAELARAGLQSDQRYTESYIHQRISRGYGPLRIRRELQERGVAAEVIEQAFAALDVDWFKAMAAVRTKKFGLAPPSDFKEQSRQSRFLQYRGFSGEQISRLFRPAE